MTEPTRDRRRPVAHFAGALVLVVPALVAGRTWIAGSPEPAQQVRSAAPAPSAVPEPEARFLVGGRLPPHATSAPRRGAAPAAQCGRSARRLGSARRALAAVVRGPTSAHRRPAGPVAWRFGRLNANGVPTVFGLLAETCDGAWLKARLPVRPNGTTGWVRRSDVRIFSVRTRLEIDLSDRRVTLQRDGRTVLRAPAAIGMPGTPTPTGRYYVNQRLVPSDPSGPFGPAAIGISAFSPVLTNWLQGGPVAVHGTNQPSLIGRAVSHGCVRVRNDVVARLFRLTPVGTPVRIRA